MYKVKQSDLVGKIKDFPIEIIQKMVSKQVHQGNKADVGIFQIDPVSCAIDGGFDLDKTKEGSNFWYDVISDIKFDVFFEKYPKKTDKVSSDLNTEEDNFIYIPNWRQETMLIKGIEDCIDKNQVIPIKLVTEYNKIIEGKK